MSGSSSVFRRLRNAGIALAIPTVLALGATFAPQAIGGPPSIADTAKAKQEDPKQGPANGEAVPLYTMSTPSGGTFETLSTSEAQQAAAQHKFTRKPGSIAALNRTASDGSQPLWRLRASAGGSYLVTGKPEERDDLVKSGQFQLEGLLGYGHAAAAKGLIALHRVSQQGKWSLAREADVPGLTGAGWHDDGVVTYAEPDHPRAGAIYFPTWNKGSSMVINATKQWFKRDNDWWGGVRDYSDPESTGNDAKQYIDHWKQKNPQHSDFSDRKPQIGFYDDTDPNVLAKQIDQATGAGLDYFSFYWYWDAVKHQQTIDGGLDTFFKAPNTSKMNAMVSLCASAPQQGNDLHVPSADFENVTQSLVDKYLKQPNYLRDNEGRPVVQLCDHRGIGDAPADSPQQQQQVVQFDSLLRTKAKDQLGADLLLLGNDNAMQSSSQGPNPSIAAMKLDGTACMGIFYGEGPQSYRDYQRKLADNMKVAPSTFGRCAQPNFDERPRYPHLIGPDAEAKIRYFTDNSLDLYGQALDGVRNDAAHSARISPIDNFTWLYAWNEWHEGGYLEPNAKDGDAQLKVTTQHLGLK